MIATLLTAALVTGSTPLEPALHGLDPVRLGEGTEVPGRGDLELERGRFRYRFADETTRRRFLADPARFEIQWGGACGRMGPLSGAGDPHRWAVHAGRIWVFASDGCRDGFLSAPERFVVAPAAYPDFGTAEREAGLAAIERAVGALGGAGAIDAPRAFRTTSTVERGGWTRHVEQLVAPYAILRRSVWTPPDAETEGSATTWVLAQDAFVDEGDRILDLTSADQRADLRRHAHREPLHLLRARHAPSFRAASLGETRLGEERLEAVRIELEGLGTTLYLEPGSGNVRALAWRGRLDDGVTREIVETLTAWHEVDGVRFPTGRTVMVDGETKPDLGPVWSEVEMLSSVPASALERLQR